MTAEVVIGNGFGVVVAADTATTRGGRTYDAAEKIFPVPRPHSIAVLHAGSVLLHGVPLTTFLDNWCLTLPEKPLNRVMDYLDDFMTYLTESILSFSTDQDLGREFLELWHKSLHRIHSFLQREETLTPEGLVDYFEGWSKRLDGDHVSSDDSYVNRLYESLGRRSNRNLFEEECHNQNCDSDLHSSIEGWIELIFGDVLEDRSRDAIYAWARKWLLIYYPNDVRATLTFVGYGAKEYLPACVSINIDGYILKKMFAQIDKNEKASRNPSGFCLFETFGQDNEIWRFIQEAGLEQNFNEQVVNEAVDRYDTISTQPPINAETVDGEDEKEEYNHSARIKDEIQSGLSEIAQRNVQEARQSLAGMNLSNVASIATRLIHLQNLALDLRGELATVGSRVVVGVISKAHGFSLFDVESGRYLNPDQTP